MMPVGGYKWLIHDPGRHTAGYFEKFRCRLDPRYSQPEQAAAEYAKKLCGDDLDKCRRFQAGVRLEVKAFGHCADRVLLKCEPYFFEAFPSAEDPAAGQQPEKQTPFQPE